MLKKEVPVRSYTGEKWKTNTTNKKYLAIDFKHRCAYCDDLDDIYNGMESYSVEHFAPKAKFPHLEYTYDNLLYSCRFCNGSKSDDWPSDSASESIVGECGYIDPCTKEYDIHLDRDENTGQIYYKTELGKYMYNHLKLYLKRHSIIYMVEKLNDKRKDLKASIDKDLKNGIDVSVKQEILMDIDNKFFSYYQLLRLEK